MVLWHLVFKILIRVLDLC